MNCLVVIAHPSEESLCRTAAKKAVEKLRAAGHEVVVADLYADGFSPALTARERASYYGPQYDGTAVQPEIDRLLAAEGLALFFPAWWFGFPAILKGWFDRVWAPGIAYDHAHDLGAIKPKLTNLRKVLAVTSFGVPWWVDRIVMRGPVKRTLKTAILGACAPAAEFRMLTLYKAERLDAGQVQRFARKVERALARWK